MHHDRCPEQHHEILNPRLHVKPKTIFKQEPHSVRRQPEENTSVPPTGGIPFFGDGTGRMNVRDIQNVLEAWAPPPVAMDRDNVGLQCGNPQAEVRGVLVALDPVEEAVEEAKRSRANLIVTHHPLLFRPLKSVTPATREGRCLRLLIRYEIAMLAAHTNLDFTRGGTSFALAEALGLERVQFLHQPYKIVKKIVTYVPAADADRIADAMAAAGAGRIGNYDHCSFRLEGTGTFRGNENSSPRRGRRGALERVPEVRLEMTVSAWDVERVAAAMRTAHPYEEVAYEIFATENPSAEYGMGIIGELASPVRLGTFLQKVRKSLGARGLRYAGDLRQPVRRVAACGGSGSDLIPEAERNGADVFVTADIRYHGFQLATPRMALVDAGHYETEFPVVGALVSKLAQAVRTAGGRIPVRGFRRSTNPVRYL